MFFFLLAPMSLTYNSFRWKKQKVLREFATWTRTRNTRITSRIAKSLPLFERLPRKWWIAVMSRSNFAWLLASLRRRSRYRPRGRRLHPPAMTRCRDEYPNPQWSNRNLASTALSRNPRAQIREPQTVGSIDDQEQEEEEEEEERKSGFLVDARETSLVLARLAIVTSVITTLLAAYLITRLTHTNAFPTILRKGNPGSEMLAPTDSSRIENWSCIKLCQQKPNRIYHFIAIRVE